MRGRIIKALSGFYYVRPEGEEGLYKCRARGIFRLHELSPYVGDYCDFEVTHEGDREGNVLSIEDRRNQLFRPTVSNVDQALLVFALRTPDPVLGLLDRFLIAMRRSAVPVILNFNKSDLSDGQDISRFSRIYKDADVEMNFTSVVEEKGLDRLKSLLKGRTTVLAGPSGAGKSSLLNLLCGGDFMETQAVSRKIGRGKQTTRHIEMVRLSLTEKDPGYIIDTPGFSSLFSPDFGSEKLQYYYPEFDSYRGDCYFQPCTHIHEPDCAVKRAAENDLIPDERYESYKEVFNSMISRR
ncbi:MAG: ribosome small subunit-dependent GTPase A [Lachnospiraceae bacterium]|nr:ribosome small subunit-dependent GTPase A [Lachnospiraceae bacterium]